MKGRHGAVSSNHSWKSIQHSLLVVNGTSNCTFQNIFSKFSFRPRGEWASSAALVQQPCDSLMQTMQYGIRSKYPIIPQ